MSYASSNITILTTQMESYLKLSRKISVSVCLVASRSRWTGSTFLSFSRASNPRAGRLRNPSTTITGTFTSILSFQGWAPSNFFQQSDIGREFSRIWFYMKVVSPFCTHFTHFTYFTRFVLSTNHLRVLPRVWCSSRLLSFRVRY